MVRIHCINERSQYMPPGQPCQHSLPATITQFYQGIIPGNPLYIGSRPDKTLKISRYSPNDYSLIIDLTCEHKKHIIV